MRKEPKALALLGPPAGAPLSLLPLTPPQLPPPPPPLQSDWLGKTTVDVNTARAQERGRLQSAALSLGAMHARLGHIEEALQALNEAVGAGAVGGGAVPGCCCG